MTTATLIPSPSSPAPAPAVAVTTPPGFAVPADLMLYRLSVEQYHSMVRHAILGPRDPVELLDGLLIRKMPEDPPHVAAIELAADALRGVLPAGWFVRVAHPITTDASEPEPDLAVARGTVRDYAQRHPRPADCAIVIEVANSSLARDRGPKRRLYAAAGVLVYWIIRIADRTVEAYVSDATGTAYAPPTTYADGDRVPVVIDGVEVGTVAVADLLP